MNQPPTVNAPDLAAVVTEVLGDMAFMVSDDAPPEMPVGAVWMQAEVRYHGPPDGTLRCWCTRAFATQLAANLLGIEPEEGEAFGAADDALREFMNVLCGQLITNWHGTETVFNLSIPTVQECDETPRTADTAGDSSCALSLDGEPLLCVHHQA